jgi:YihY family inner membrane protein
VQEPLRNQKPTPPPPSSLKERVGSRADAVADVLDRIQRRRRTIGFLTAVVKRYREDRGTRYAALISYYGFFSIFPLLLALVTILGLVLQDRPELQQDILDTVLSRIPVLGSQIERSIRGPQDTGLVLALSFLTAIWAGLAVLQITQDAMNTAWGMPRYERPGLLRKRLRSLGALGVVGLAVIAATGAAAITSGVTSYGLDLPFVAQALTVVGSLVINVGALLGLFALTTAVSPGILRLLPGAVIGGVALFALQLVGGYYVGYVVKGASDVYGAFAVAIGLLVWISLVARAVLLAGEVNVVHAKRLWPRSLTGRGLTEADERAYAELAAREARLPGQEVTIRLDRSGR